MKEKFSSLMFTFILSAVLFVLPGNLKAQEENAGGPVSLEYGGDLVSRYVWRGMQFGTGVQVQPYTNLVFSADNHSFKLGLWGSYDLGGKVDSIDAYSEFDISFGYSFSTENIGTFSVGAADYYFPYLKIPYSNFEKDGLGGHTVEVSLGYAGPEDFPVTLLATSNVFNDLPEEKSLYFEAGYSVELNNVPISFFAGFAQGPSTWHQTYSDGVELVNLGVTASRSFEITENYAVTASVSLIRNTYLQEFHPVIRLSF